MVADNDLLPLLKHDQLSLQRVKYLAFEGFEEGEIHFKPTFKVM